MTANEIKLKLGNIKYEAAYIAAKLWLLDDISDRMHDVHMIDTDSAKEFILGACKYEAEIIVDECSDCLFDFNEFLKKFAIEKE